jgi:HAD superfamily hydrolase (TIGR01549 family)
MNADRVVLFDWDGTLIDSLEIKIQNASILFQEVLGFDPQTAAFAYRQHSGIPRRELFEAICVENGMIQLREDIYQRLSQRFSAMNLASLTDKSLTNLVPVDTTVTLSALHKQGYPLYISSSAIAQEIHLVARLHNLEEYFQEILGSAPGFNKGPQHVAYVMKQQNAIRQQIVFVGDEPTDITLGRSANVFVIAKIGTYPPERLWEAGPDRVIKSLSELPIILRENLVVP